MKLSRDAAEALAAEYVLGTLRGPARARFASLASRDAAVAGAMRRWEAAFAPLAQRVAPIDPPERVWRAIESRIAPAASRRASFWKPFGVVMGGVASVMLAFFLWLSLAPAPEPMFEAMLMSPDHTPRMVVAMFKPDGLRVKMMHPWKNMPGKSLELWAIPKEGSPRSLGMVSNEAPETMVHVAENDPRLADAKAFAVSLEPMGGSPTGQPTGPVLCSGAITAVRRT
ncbi:MAG TPA: anti-sigma factor [Usitatibacter sp.]|nr:anti-sigma factor [Usitatibacter sp.]